MKKKAKQTHKKVRPHYHVKSGDFVQVISGAFKGVQGKILKVIMKKARIHVEGVPKLKKAIRPSQQNPQGGFAEIDRPIHVSNVKKIEAEVKPAKASAKAPAKKATKTAAKKKID